MITEDGTDLGPGDWVELRNRTSSVVDVSGWFLSDDAANPQAYMFPPGSTVRAAGQIVVEQAELGFGLAVDGSDVLLLTAPDGVTAMDYFDFGPQTTEISRGRFPDSVTARGRKHAELLGELAAAGERGVLLFVVQRGDSRSVEPAEDIDPAYAEALRRAVARGAEVLAVGARVTPTAIVPTRPLPVLL